MAHSKSVKTLLTASVVLSAFAAPALAEEMTLRFTNVFADTHFTNEEGVKPFMEAVEEATGGKIKFELFPGAQLGKHAAEIVGQGLADGGLVVPSYEPDKLPLTSVAELPAMHATACEGSRKVWEMLQEGGVIYEAEYKPLGLYPIFAYNLQPYEVHTTKKKVEKLEDIAGLKLRANGSAQDKTIRALGGVPVRVTGPELYDSLNRGTVDGGMWLAFASKPYSLDGVLMYGVKGTALGAGGVNVLALSQEVWSGLDAETQNIMKEAGKTAAERVCKWLDDGDAESTQDLVDTADFEVTYLSDEELARWNEAVASVSTDWAAEMDASGRPGTEILQAFQALE